MRKDSTVIRKEFEKAYDEYFSAIFLYLASRLSDRERSKELAQETFMRAWKYVADGNVIANIRPFLYTTASNLFKNELRAKKDIRSLDELIDLQGYDPADITSRPIQSMAEGRRLIAQIEDLSPLHQEVLTLRYIEDLSIKEIAEKLDAQPVTISVRIHRALQQLRELYEPATASQ